MTLGLLLSATLLASCTGFQVEDQSLQFNQATGSVGNRVMLLNAVRAAHGYPLQFSKVTSYSGQGTVDGGLSIDLPFVLNTFGNPSATRILGTARPSSAFKSGVSQLQLADLNTAEIQRKLRTQVAARDFAYYRSQGWLKTLVNTILIEELQLERELVKKLEDASKASCDPGGSAASSKRDRQTLVCRWRQKALRECGDDIDPDRRPQRRASREGNVVVVFTNDPRRYCQFVAFQWFFASIRVLDSASVDVDADLDVDTDECTTRWGPPRETNKQKKEAKGSKEKSKGGRDEDKQVSESVKDGKVSVDIGVNVKVAEKKDEEESDKKAPEQHILINIPRNLGPTRLDSVVKEYARLDRLRNEQLCLLKEGKSPISVVWRSPERMVRYLGDVLAVHTLGAGEKRGPVQILNEDGELVDLFQVERGRGLLGIAAVAVEGPEGERFFIPLSEPGSKKAHLSLQALALVMESFNLAVSGKALPQPATLFLSGG